MKTAIAVACVCLLAPRVAQAEILFDLDPNVPDILDVQFSTEPVIPSPLLEPTFGFRTDQGWEWTIVTLRPVPAGTFDVSQMTIAARSSLPTKLGAQYEIANGHGTWAGPLGILTGDALEVPLKHGASTYSRHLATSQMPLVHGSVTDVLTGVPGSS